MNEIALINRLIELTDNGEIKWCYMLRHQSKNIRENYISKDPGNFECVYNEHRVYIQKGWICINSNFNIKNPYIDELFEKVSKIYEKERRKYYQDDYEDKVNEIKKAFNI